MDVTILDVPAMVMLAALRLLFPFAVETASARELRIATIAKLTAVLPPIAGMDIAKELKTVATVPMIVDLILL